MDIRQSESWGNYLENLGWKSEKISSQLFAYVRPVPILGSIIKVPRCPLPIPFKEIDRIAHKHNAAFVKLEPEIETNKPSTKKLLRLLKNEGYKNSSWSLNPLKTLKVNLGKSEEELLKTMEKDTRYSIKLAIRKGVQVEETNDFNNFKQIYYDTAKRKKFWPAKKELETLWSVFSKENKAVILTASYKKEALATCMLLFDGHQGYYSHAASLEKHRKVMAPYLLLWHSMMFLKRKSALSFDLEGVKDDRYAATKKWGGFTLFKRGFGGEEVEYLGSFTKYYKLWPKILFLSKL